jgi:Amt family ammonium transporter
MVCLLSYFSGTLLLAELGAADIFIEETSMGRMFRSIGRRCALPILVVLLSLGAMSSVSFGDGPATPSAPSTVDPKLTVNAGDTAWMLVSSALVMLMVPGLALFYGGMVRRKNVLGTIMHSMACLGIIGVEWVIIGYAMAFGKDYHGIIGWDPQLLFLKGILPGHVHAGTGETSGTAELVYVMFQGMFAIITPALITGAFAERVKFSAFAIFTLLWGLLIYNPLAHWVWAPGGWLGTQGGLGAIDFAGGTVVHISAGASALVTALYLGKRIGYPQSVLQPNALVLTLLGAGLLWFGWFGFNGGSAVASNGVAGLAFTTTQIAAAAGGLAWLIAEWMKHGRPTSLGFASGLVAGLVAITPASGFVPPWAALIIGAAAGVVCYGAVLMKGKFGYDDSLDAFGVHGIGGFLGALLTGVFAVKIFGGTPGLIDGAGKQVVTQLIAAVSAAAFAGVGTLILMVVINKLIGFRVSRPVEIEGMDTSIHGEEGWMLSQVPGPSNEIPGSASVDLQVARDTARERAKAGSQG